MSDFWKFLLKAFVRKGLTAAGAVLLYYGVITADEGETFTQQWLEPVLGGVLLGASSVWTYIYNRYVKRKIETAIEMPPDTTRLELERATKAKKESE